MHHNISTSCASSLKTFVKKVLVNECIIGGGACEQFWSCVGLYFC